MMGDEEPDHWIATFARVGGPMLWATVVGGSRGPVEASKEAGRR
jgi:hypothetical protein